MGKSAQEKGSITTWENSANVVVVLTDKPGLTTTTNNLNLAAFTTNTLHAEPRATNNLGLVEPTANITHVTDYLGLVTPTINVLPTTTTSNLGLATPTTNTLIVAPLQSIALDLEQVILSNTHLQIPRFAANTTQTRVNPRHVELHSRIMSENRRSDKKELNTQRMMTLHQPRITLRIPTQERE